MKEKRFMKNSDLRGLDEDLARQARQTKKMGGPSDILKRMKKRPLGGISRDGYLFIGDIDPDLQPKKKWNWKK